MAKLAAAPLYLKDVTLTIDPGDGTGDDFARHVSGVVFTPQAQAATWQGLSPDAAYTETSSASWTATLTYAQDWDSAGSLSRFLFDREGEQLVATFRPRAGTGPSFRATVVVVPGAIGGNVNAHATASVTLGVQGRPELLPAAPAV